MEQEITQQELSELRITEEAKQYLKATSSWTTFYAIICFISVGFLAIFGVIMLLSGSFLSSMGTYSYASFSNMPFMFAGFLYIVLAVVLIFPALYLYRFSKKTSEALALNDTETLTSAFENMKSYWKFIGIMTIISIAFALLSFLILIITALSGFGI